MSAIGVKKYSLPTLSKSEVLRYAKAGGKEDITEALGALISEAMPLFDPSVVYSVFELKTDGDTLLIGEVGIRSLSLKKALEGCTRVIVFVAGVGAKIDRMVNKYTKISPLRALFSNAIGAAGVEELCDMFCRDAEREYGKVTRRFSPGYGDLPLDLQKAVFELLNPEKHIGITLTDGMLMTPMKSVSAFIGIKRTEK